MKGRNWKRGQNVSVPGEMFLSSRAASHLAPVPSIVMLGERGTRGVHDQLLCIYSTQLILQGVVGYACPKCAIYLNC